MFSRRLVRHLSFPPGGWKRAAAHVLHCFGATQIETLVGEGATRYICDTLSFFIDRMNDKVKEESNRCSDADKSAWLEELRRQNLPEKAKSFAQKFFPECCPQVRLAVRGRMCATPCSRSCSIV